MSPDCWIFVTERPPDFSRPRTRRGRFPWACGVPPRRRMVHGIFEKGVGNLSRPVVPMEGHWLATGGQPPRVSPGPRPRHGAGIYSDSRLHGTCRAQLRSTPRASASAPGCSRSCTRAYPAPLLVARGAHCPVARGAHCPAAWRPRPRLAARSSRLAGPGAGSSSEIRPRGAELGRT